MRTMGSFHPFILMVGPFYSRSCNSPACPPVRGERGGNLRSTNRWGTKCCSHTPLLLRAKVRAPLREFVPPLIVVWRRPCGMAHFSLRLITQSVGTIETAMKQGAGSHL